MASSSSPEPPKKATQASQSSRRRPTRARKQSSSSEAASSDEDSQIEEVPTTQTKRKLRSSLAGPGDDDAPPSQASRRLTRGSIAPSSVNAKAGPSSSRKHVESPASSSKKAPSSSRRVEVVVAKPTSQRKRKSAAAEDDDEEEEEEEYRPPRQPRRAARAPSSADSDDLEVEEAAPRQSRTTKKQVAGKKDKKKKKGRGRPPGRAQPRRDTSEAEEEEEASEAEDQGEASADQGTWSTPPFEKLDSKEHFKELMSVELRDEVNMAARIKKGDVVEFSNGGVGEPWYAAIQSSTDSLTLCSGLRSDFKVATGDNGEPVRGPKGTTVKSLSTPWFAAVWLYTKDMFKELPSDSTKWRWAPELLVSMGRNERIATDDLHWQTKDALACPWFDDEDDDDPTPPQERSSAVTVFRFNDFYPGAASTGFRTSHPLRHFRELNKKEAPPPVPSYFWGDASDSDSDDEFATAPWVRTSFDFKPTEDAKRRASLAGKKRPDGKAITFNKHSISRKAYNPTHVQIYGPVAKKWFDVADLKKGEHYACVNRAQELAGLLEDSSDDSNASNDEDEDSDSEPVSTANGKRKKAPSKSKAKSDSRKKARLSAVAESPLNQLAKSQIVRGGAYGLIGNSYLVTRAAELIRKVVDADDSDDEAEAQEEGEQLLEDEKEWKKGVEARKKKGMEVGAPPKGQQWVCPSL